MGGFLSGDVWLACPGESGATHRERAADPGTSGGVGGVFPLSLHRATSPRCRTCRHDAECLPSTAVACTWSGFCRDSFFGSTKGHETRRPSLGNVPGDHGWLVALVGNFLRMFCLTGLPHPNSTSEFPKLPDKAPDMTRNVAGTPWPAVARVGGGDLWRNRLPGRGAFPDCGDAVGV